MKKSPHSPECVSSIGIVLVFTVTFVLTWFFGFDDKKDLGK